MRAYAYPHSAMTLRLPPELHDRLRRRATTDQTTMRAVVLAALDRHLQEDE